MMTAANIETRIYSPAETPAPETEGFSQLTTADTDWTDEEQDASDPHGYCPPYPLAPCRAHGGRATVQERYTAILYPLQSLSSCDVRRGRYSQRTGARPFSFLLFWRFVSHGRGSKGRQPIASRRVVRGAYIPCVCWPSEIGDGSRYASDTLSGEEDSSPIFLTGSLVHAIGANQ